LLNYSTDKESGDWLDQYDQANRCPIGNARAAEENNQDKNIRHSFFIRVEEIKAERDGGPIVAELDPLSDGPPL